MADIIPQLRREPGAPARDRTGLAEAALGADPYLITFVELLFFAYRDFTGEADTILAEYQLGRAHHRVLHFVNRHPGLRVADLLDILKITKQSLARVLKELVDRDWILQRSGERDRRQRLLYVSDKGARLAARLDSVQARRVAQALAAAMANAGGAEQRAIARFLFAIIAPEERHRVEELLPAAAGKRG